MRNISLSKMARRWDNRFLVYGWLFRYKRSLQMLCLWDSGILYGTVVGLCCEILLRIILSLLEILCVFLKVWCGWDYYFVFSLTRIFVGSLTTVYATRISNRSICRCGDLLPNCLFISYWLRLLYQKLCSWRNILIEYILLGKMLLFNGVGMRKIVSEDG